MRTANVSKSFDEPKGDAVESEESANVNAFWGRRGGRSQRTDANVSGRNTIVIVPSKYVSRRGAKPRNTNRGMVQQKRPIQ